MKNITCIAIDDEPMALSIIEQFCSRKGGIELTTFNEPLIGMEQIRLKKPDLVLFDIHMNSISGLEIANILQNKCCFIFTTAYAKYAIEGFDLDAVDFLHKPFSYERFEIAVEKALRRLDAIRHSVPDTLVVKQEYNNVNIPVSDISYIEALGNYVKIVRISGISVLTRTNMKNIIKLLPKEGFIPIHRSYIISTAAVDSFTKKHIILKGAGKEIPVGSQYSEYLMKALGK